MSRGKRVKLGLAVDLPGEVWVLAPGYDGRLEVSNLGRARRARNIHGSGLKGELYRCSVSFHGYPMVGMTIGGRQVHRRLHQAIAAAFHGPCPEGMEVAHEDGVRINVRADNLSYKTRTANVRDKYRHGTMLFGERSPTAKLSEADVRAIRSSTDLTKDLAARFNVHRTQIYRIRTAQRWQHMGQGPGGTGHLRGASHPRAKLRSEDAVAIRRSQASTRQLAAAFDVAESTIRRVRRGTMWAHLSEAHS